MPTAASEEKGSVLEKGILRFLTAIIHIPVAASPFLPPGCFTDSPHHIFPFSMPDPSFHSCLTPLFIQCLTPLFIHFQRAGGMRFNPSISQADGQFSCNTGQIQIVNSGKRNSSIPKSVPFIPHRDLALETTTRSGKIQQTEESDRDQYRVSK
jgi:hypothetical protein